METLTFLLWQLVRFAIFLAVALAVTFPFLYAVLAAGERGEEDRSPAGLFWRGMFWLVVGLIVLVAVFPFYYAILSSLETGTALFRVNYLPESFNLANYRDVLTRPAFVRAVGNSVFVATITVIAALILAVTASYALARVRFRGRGLLLMTILAVSMFPQIAVLSGLYELINWLGLYNTPWSLILSYTIFTLPFTVWVLTTFMRDLPIEIEEAAIMDGASPWIIITRVFMPLLWPALVTTGLLAFIGAWNEFLFALTFTISENQRTVPVAIAIFTGASVQEIPWGPIMAASVLVTVPLIVLVLVFQRKIVAGLTAGGVKG
ncbi:carbohydrate ABC transporter membrane protein 2 [Rubellimicrobium thermophilum DSM 16684]|uniref:Carbohydrate ABC transporter membrane protein 2 n=1 Tax=Rubellimicrobium thermophilum DSM 16684 TaxID=1123069 RepID=S9QSU7_9RHOB|nr:carbohydrate ABC transporter permease [Rubellimicrobium thermophilum]EPX82728.1 carbohydrate ABC transporter membrane protein 2 [Rubellimicrobium thermophilum DSM 16684]